MDENSYSFGLYLGEFLDKAAVAMSEIATAAEDFVNKVIENSKDLQHPADAKRIELLENLPIGINNDNIPPSPLRQKKRSSTSTNKKTSGSIKKANNTTGKENKTEERQNQFNSDESSESSSEILATQRTGKAAGFSANHYLVTEAEADDDGEENEEEEEEEDYDSEYSTYSNV